ncbi:MAG: hypothetical protein AB1444_16395 [Spirochaetota bacterium]
MGDSEWKNKRLEVRYSIASLLIAETFVLILTIIGVESYISSKINDALIVTICIIIFGIFIYLWFRAFRITVENGVLTYKQLFGKTRVIRIDDIEEAYTEIGVKHKGDEYRAFIRLMIKPKKGCGVEGFYINLKPFEEKGIHQLFEILPMRKGKKSRRLSVLPLEKDEDVNDERT